ncbi:MAG: pilus (MSHA type) biogenesis protein MshL [Campylobacterota bacterium]
MKNKILILLGLTLIFAYGAQANCKYQLFNVTANENVLVEDIVRHISNECDYTVVVKDSFSKEKMKEPLYLLNLKNATVGQVLDVALRENELNYTIKNDVLKISYLFTETFFIDYIGTSRSGTSNTNITLTSNTGNEGGTGSGADSSSEMNIKSGDIFEFWSKIESQVNSIMNRPEDSYKVDLSDVAEEGEEEDGNKAQNILINKEAGLITVTGTKKQVERVESYIDLLQDRLKKQVLIDVKIYSVTLDKSNTTGIDWNQIYGLQNFEVTSFAMGQSGISSYEVSEDGGLTGEVEFAPDTQPRNANLLDVRGQASIGEVVKFLKGQGDVSSISNPKVLTLNNQPALVSVGNEYFYKTTSSTTTQGDGGQNTTEDEQVNSVFAGVLLDITPEISNEGVVTLKINPSLSETIGTISSSDQSSRNMPPDLTRRQMSSVVSVKDGEHVVLGGLITTKDSQDVSKVPLLGDMPLLGYLFKQEKTAKQSEELVIIVTPKIVKVEDKMNLEELGYNQVEY